MSPSRPDRRARPLRVLLCAASVFSGCLRDEGLVDPDRPGPLPVLATVHGKAVTEGPQAFDPARLLRFPDPKVALVWEFIGTKVTGVSAFGKVSVDVESPFRFTVEINEPPPPEVALSKEPVFGHFWLYSDGDGDGAFSRYYHPDHAALMGRSDTLGRLFEAAEASFREAAVASPDPFPVRDTFYLEGFGTILHATGGRLDTLFVGRSASDTNAHEDVVFRRLRLLKDYNSWENFFALRKRAHDTWKQFEPLPGGRVRMVWNDWIRMIPRPGMEAEFEARLQRATTAYLERFGTLAAINRDALRKGWIDYRYQGIEPEGLDWVAARSRWYHFLYFPDSASLRTVLQAERNGSFRVDGLERLRRGYNMLHCDDQYRCKVLADSDTIRLDLGQTEAYFNPPASPLKPPVARFEPKGGDTALLERIAGGYRYRTYGSVNVASEGGESWIEIPGLGMHRLTRADSLAFYVPGRDLQAEFVPAPTGEVYKLLLYHAGNRSVCLREASPASPAPLIAEARARLAAGRTTLVGSLAALGEAAFHMGADTLRLAPAGDSLECRVGTQPVQYLHPLSDSVAVGAATGDRLLPVPGPDGAAIALRLRRDGRDYLLPRLGYAPRPASALFPGAPTGPGEAASENEGSAGDTYLGPAGRKRYACDGDKAFLADGDGWARLLRAGGTGDSISMKRPGEGLRLRLTGLAGRWATLTVRICGESGGGPRRVLASLRGRGPGSGPEGDVLSDYLWLGISAAGDSAAYGPFPVPADPYEVDLVRLPTADPETHFAIDGYRVEAE